MNKPIMMEKSKFWKNLQRKRQNIYLWEQRQRKASLENDSVPGPNVSLQVALDGGTVVTEGALERALPRVNSLVPREICAPLKRFLAKPTLKLVLGRPSFDDISASGRSSECLPQLNLKENVTRVRRCPHQNDNAYFFYKT